MENLTLQFTIPWLLLLLIPAVFFTLFSYFRIQKRYRRNRNRIISVVLHLIVMTLSILVLSGTTIEYDKPNDENEIILLVDMSFSGKENDEAKVDFVESVIEQSGVTFKVGVVTFGFDQVYAAELSNDPKRVKRDFNEANLPDITATNVEGALSYARTLFSSPETAKIVLITDGIETDGSALDVIKSIAAEGIKVDTVYFPNDYDDNREVQIVDIKTPDYTVAVGEEFKILAKVQSSFSGVVDLTVYDNEDEKTTVSVNVKAGDQEIELPHSLGKPGLHEITVSLNSSIDELAENNDYRTYMYLEEYTNILIIESQSGESDNLKSSIIAENHNMQITTINSYDEAMPKTIEQLQQYDEVIFYNIANADLPDGFIALMDTYVSEIGGGLLTVGGNKNGVFDENGNPVANAYVAEDMANTDYQDMLPVKIIEYTPPLGVMFIIDRSGSMSTDVAVGDESYSKLDAAKLGALAVLDDPEAITERDWAGVMSLETSYNTEINLTPKYQMDRLRAAINGIEMGGGTEFTSAVERAAQSLIANTHIQKRHMVLITDGMPSDPFEQYAERVKYYNEKYGITLSVIIIGTIDGTNKANMEALVGEECGHGKLYIFDNSENIENLGSTMRSDLKIDDIRAYNPEDFSINIKIHNSIIYGVNTSELPQLGGYYGSKAREGAQVIFEGPSDVPLYAQWKYGNGSVGSFMCDLGGIWSNDFIINLDGRRLVYNMIASVFPTRNIRPSGIDVALREDNYTTNVSIYTKLEEGQTVEIKVISPRDELTGQPVEQTIYPNADEGYSRTSFVLTRPGLHEVYVVKKAANGTEIEGAYFRTYRPFSYSEEYNMFVDEEAVKSYLSSLASYGKGSYISEEADENGASSSLKSQIYKIFDEFERYVHRSIDPRLAFIITAVTLFLLDIAVRKFKFKWPHEIIRDRKAKKEMINNN